MWLFLAKDVPRAMSLRIATNGRVVGSFLDVIPARGAQFTKAYVG